MPVINGVYLKDFTALPSSVTDANIIPIAITGDQVAYKTTVAGIVTDARITSKLLTGLSVTGSTILATDTILQAFGKVQNQLNGKVSSVGLTMPAAFNVANSPITSAGTLAVTAAGVASQYIRGDGALADFPTTGGGGSSVSYYLNGSVSQGTFVGNTYYEMNKTPVIGAGTDFSIGADGYIAQFITDANDPASLLIPAGNWNVEMYFSASSSGGTPSFYVEVYKYDGTTFTLLGSSSATPEGITNGTAIDIYYTSVGIPETVLTITDRLAIRVYVTHSGRTITLHTEDNHLSEIVTTFSNGLTTLNGLTKQSQYFAVGSTGTDFAIVSSVDTHTFNIPSASASNRGLITTGTQTIAGAKTFNSDMFINSITVGRGTGNIAGNTTVGANALYSNTIGTNNIALGDNALYSNTSGGNNTALGANALYLNTSGGNNTANGFQSLYTNAGGLNNTAIGVQALYTNLVGNKNTALGVNALYDITSGDNNIAIGYDTGDGITTGSGNTILGANITGLTAGLTNNIILANGTGSIKAQNDATNWTFASAAPIFTGLGSGIIKATTGTLSIATAGTDYQSPITLTTTGTSGAATFSANTLNIPNYADGGVLSLSAIGGTANANGATITGTVLNLQPANASFGGVVTTGTQTIAGDKTLTGTLYGIGLSMTGTTADIVQGTATSGKALRGTATTGWGLYASATTGVGVQGNSSGTGGSGVFGSSVDGYGGVFYNDSTTYAALEVNNNNESSIAVAIFRQGGSSIFTVASVNSTLNTTLTANSFIPSSSTVPTNGMYLSAANTLNFSTNTTSRLSIASTGAATFSSTVQTTGIGLGATPSATQLINGTISSTNTVFELTNTNASGYGGYIRAATGGTQYILRLVDKDGNTRFSFYGDGTSSFSGAATFSGKITSTANGEIFNNTSAAANSVFQQFTNTSGNAVFGIEGSGAGGTFTGTSAYATIIGNGVSKSLQLVTNGTVRLTIDSAGAATFAGSVSKASGSFRIPHPLPSLSETHQLVHSFIEGPQADLIYRGKLTLLNGKAQANIDEVSTMTEGTFEVLCREVQCFTTNESGWDLVKGKVIGNIIYIESQNENSTDEISWMVIGERKDKHMMETEWTDENGKVIVEPLKPIEPIIPTDNNLE